MSPSPARLALVGGLVADGCSSDPSPGDVLVSGGRIEAVVSVAERPAGGYDAEVVDVTGRIVAPGFVDIHCHSDLTLLAYPGNASRVTQGITTEVVGNCGMTPAPGNADERGLAGIIATIDIVPGSPRAWSDVPGWLEALDRAPTATNVAAHVGHGSARFAVAGAGADPLTDDELRALDRELRDALDAGCVGVSVGLMYAPGEHATGAELTAIAELVAAHDGVLSAHLRDYRPSRLPEAIDELAAPAARAGARLQISHLRGVGGEDGFASVVEHLERLREHQDVAADAYPYVHGHTTLIQLLPTALRAAGPGAAVAACREDLPAVAAMLRESGYEPADITIMKAPTTPRAIGLSLDEVATDPWTWLARLLLENEGRVDVAVASGRWRDVDLALRTPWISIASDGTALDAGHTASMPHPRSWGAFSAAYRRMRDAGIAAGDAVRRMSTEPAARAGLRSGIAAGARADLVVLDDARFDSPATFGAPATPSAGLDHVYVRGVAVLQHGRETGATPGTLLRKGSDD